MKNVDEKEASGCLRIFLSVCGFKLEVEGEGQVRMRRSVGQSSECQVIEGQVEYVEDDIVEDVDPAELSKLEQL